MPSDVKKRITSIDIMRGWVMLLMTIDHVRERFYLHHQVSDPMDVETTSPGLFFTRLLAHFCAPVFVFLTGLSAWLYQHNSRAEHQPLTGFLFKRGVFLVVLEVTLITFSWMGNYHTVYLQVMWAIGLSMIALSVLHHLPPWLMAAMAIALVFGHNLLTPLNFAPDDWGYSLWTILHDRGYLLSNSTINIKVSYPLLPWIGVIIFGYLAGPLYCQTAHHTLRQRWLLYLGVSCLTLFTVLRGSNIYGETLPWQPGETAMQTLMSFVNLTKYPPSLDFLLLTLGMMFICLRSLAQITNTWGEKCTQVLAQFGGAPMFFYLLHLYLLLILYQGALAIWGTNHGNLFGVDDLSAIWAISLLLVAVLYWPTKTFATYKRRTRQMWVKYL